MPSIWFVSGIIFLVCLSGLMFLAFFFRKSIDLKGYVTEATIALVLGTLIMGSFQMYVSEKQDKAQFLLDLKESFYSSNDTNRKVITAIENGTLRIYPDSSSDTVDLPKNAFFEGQVDEYIINFDYMNIFLKKQMLDEKDIYYVFGWYIRRAWNNAAIKEYIKGIRLSEKDVYVNFEELAGRMQEILREENSKTK